MCVRELPRGGVQLGDADQDRSNVEDWRGLIAHEVGHHVQNLLGITDRAEAAQRSDPAARNAVSVRVELQADCLARVWGHSAAQRSLLDRGDVKRAFARPQQSVTIAYRR